MDENKVLEEYIHDYFKYCEKINHTTFLNYIIDIKHLKTEIKSSNIFIMFQDLMKDIFDFNNQKILQLKKENAELKKKLEKRNHKEYGDFLVH